MQLSPFAVLQTPSLGQCVAIWSRDASERESGLCCAFQHSGHGRVGQWTYVWWRTK